MSLLIAARYRDGVILASDPFVFDNDPVRPSRRLDFDRFHVAADQSVVFAAVGSLWVFREFCRRFDAESAECTPTQGRVRTLWRELCERWRAGRAGPANDGSSSSFRALSDSLLIAVRREEPWHMDAISADGAVSTSRTFIVTGSAASWVREHLLPPKSRFHSRDTLDRALRRIHECFAAGARDLFVVGFPAIASVNTGGIVDFSSESEAAWGDARNAAADLLSRRALRDAVDDPRTTAATSPSRAARPGRRPCSSSLGRRR